MTDPIADLLTRIRNGLMARHTEVKIPFSRIKLEIVKILHREGFIGAYQTPAAEGAKKTIEVTLRYVGKNEPAISSLVRVSRPGLRRYVQSEEIPVVRSGMGLTILTTSKGLMTDSEARAAKLGGEILCSVW